MKVLTVGSGGREHAVVWRVTKSPKVEKTYYAPSNAGIAGYAGCVDIGVMELEKLTPLVVEQKIDLIIVDPDDPLAARAVDAFEAVGPRVLGPRRSAAILETSKVFSKDLMKKYDIPTARYKTSDSPEEALAYLETVKMPIILRTGDPALGKGVLIYNTLEEVEDGIGALVLDKQFGTAGSRTVMEEFATGREASVPSFVDGNTIEIVISAQDHKRAKDGDQGLSTDGMGTLSPSPLHTDEVGAFCQKRIYQATVDAVKAKGREPKGIIFFGLMLTKNGPRVLEYNARSEDPEIQVVLPRMKSGIVDVSEACIDGTLDKAELEFKDNVAVCAVPASAGYPEHYEKDFKIHGLDTFRGRDGYYVFYASNKLDADGDIITNGRRVLGVTATGATLKEAHANAYEAAGWIAFDNKYMRGDIGKAIDEV